MLDWKVTMLGTGSPRPDLDRSGPSQVLHLGDAPVLIDCGEGTTAQLQRAGIPPQSITTLFMTHLHSDHLLGYGQFLLGGWGLGRRQLRIVGPKGMKHYHETILSLFKEDIDYRISLGRSPKGVRENVEIIEIEEPGEIEQFSEDIPARIYTEKMIHNVPTYGFRFEGEEQVIVHSGDTAPTENIIKLAKGADILIQDACLAVNETYKNITDPELQKIWDNLQKEHCSPAQAADIAEKAGVKKLVMTHFLPNIDEKRAYDEAVAVFDGETIVAQDLQTIGLSVSVTK
ncbi:MBL fold metallo-hydrolase [Halobacillus shinanisalinarum]|uniref:MBL fold metallo-hydrolase n=1 Tax=Halobacillus shinanisalinarum TaxID=2932258 RepID=A0ABY4H388_9BACI|nr:MBL fold metallo-hydrolase [Halobacillus shinanisalinarum]UOQ94756.1 MBL fold metallo-hydrolase [Halobacillus shinanisalinarum]